MDSRTLSAKTAAPKIAPPNLLLPWHTIKEEDHRFWRVLRWCLLPFLLLSLAIPLIHTPEPDREELEKLPPQLARIVLKEKELPPPPVVEKQPDPKEPEPEELASEEEPRPEPKPKPAQVVQQARETARKSGVLQFTDDLAAMRDSIDLSDLNDTTTVTRGNAEATQVDRALIASRSDTTSGGIDTSELSRNTGGAALSGRETTQVESTLAKAVAASAVQPQRVGAEQPERSDEDIRKIMDRNKSAIFAIYNRALRRDPTLEGRVIVKIVIEPGGAVSSVQIVSTDLNHDDLERKVMARIRLIDFGANNVGTTTVNYTFDFLPS